MVGSKHNNITSYSFVDCDCSQEIENCNLPNQFKDVTKGLNVLFRTNIKSENKKKTEIFESNNNSDFSLSGLLTIYLHKHYEVTGIRSLEITLL